MKLFKLGSAACALCFIGVTACVNSVVGADAATTHAALFDELWSSVNNHYSFFDYKRIDWDSLRTVYRPQAIAAGSDYGLSVVLSDMLRQLRDVHVTLRPFGSYVPLRYQGRGDVSSTFYQAYSVFQRYVGDPDTHAIGPKIRAGMIGSDVGYMQIDDFVGDDWAGDVDLALDKMADARSVIVDVRDNTGGSYALAIDIAGRFTQQETTFGFLRFRNGLAHTDFTDFAPEVVKPTGVRRAPRPTFVIVNARTTSSAEVFTLAMRSNPNVVVIGDTTAGASGGPTARELSNGWIYEVSEWMEYTRDRKLYEGVGLAPDYVTTPTYADFEARKDPALEIAFVLAKTATHQ